MGGEWIFCFKDHETESNGATATNIQPFNVQAYQEELVELRKTYENQLNPKYVTWCKNVPPEDNIFIKFQFTCKRHSHWNEPEHPWFAFYWTPTGGVHGSVHDRCGIDFSTNQKLFEMQKRIAEKFSEHFHLYRDFTDSRVYDSDKGGCIDYGGYYSDDQESLQDFTACDKDDCGYCGHCFY